MIAVSGPGMPYVHLMDMEPEEEEGPANQSDLGSFIRDLETPKYGAERYMEEQLALGGGRTISGSDRKSGAVYKSGPYKRMTKGQASEQIRKNYAAMPDRQRMTYERGAQGGDVISGRERGIENRHYAAQARAKGIDGSPIAGQNGVKARSFGASGGGGGGTTSALTPQYSESGVRVRSFGERAEPIDTPSLQTGSVQGAPGTSPGIDYLRSRGEVAKRAIKPSSTPISSVRSSYQPAPAGAQPRDFGNPSPAKVTSGQSSRPPELLARPFGSEAYGNAKSDMNASIAAHARNVNSRAALANESLLPQPGSSTKGGLKSGGLTTGGLQTGGLKTGSVQGSSGLKTGSTQGSSGGLRTGTLKTGAAQGAKAVSPATRFSATAAATGMDREELVARVDAGKAGAKRGFEKVTNPIRAGIGMGRLAHGAVKDIAKAGGDAINRNVVIPMKRAAGTAMDATALGIHTAGAIASDVKRELGSSTPSITPRDFGGPSTSPSPDPSAAGANGLKIRSLGEVEKAARIPSSRPIKSKRSGIQVRNL